LTLEPKKSVIELELLLAVSSSFLIFELFFERSTFTAPIPLDVPEPIEQN
jgi:hypothetical protein